MEKLSAEFAEILGLLCAEGCYVLRYDNYFAKDKNKVRFYKNHKSERIEFFNKDRKLIKHFKYLLAKEFDYYPKVTKFGKINICRRDIIRKIMGKTKIGHIKWKVPEAIINSGEKIKILFLRGYFDGDGTRSNRVRMFSTNFGGLKQVSKILMDLKIKHTFPKPILKENIKPLYYIQISEGEKERFLNVIKPISK